MTHTRFIQRSTETISFQGMPGWFSSLLYARGIRTSEEAEHFLNPSLDGLHDPFLLPGMQKTVDLLKDAIAGKNEVTLIDVTEQPSADLTGYDRIGFASGIYYNSFAKQILSFAQDHLPENKDVFFIFTHGAPKGTFLTSIRKITEGKHCRELGSYHCTGYDTFGPFKLVGGIAKGHPTEKEIDEAVSFYRGL